MFVRAYDRELACVGSYRALQQAAGRAPAARRLAHERSPWRRDELSNHVPLHVRTCQIYPQRGTERLEYYTANIFAARSGINLQTNLLYFYPTSHLYRWVTYLAVL